MAARGLLMIRKLLGNRSNAGAGAGLHHRRKICSNSSQTLASLTSIASDSELHYLQHRRHLSSAAAAAAASTVASESLPSIPKDMVRITTKSEYKSALKQVRDGRLPAVFFFFTELMDRTVKEISPIIRMLREKFPHVTIYKTMLLKVCILEVMADEAILTTPTFHLYKDGTLVDVIRGPIDEDEGTTRDPFPEVLIDAFGELYRYVKPPQPPVIQAKKYENGGGVPTSSSGIQANKYENDGVVEGRKLGAAASLSQQRGAATLSQRNGPRVEAVERTTAPSLHQVMRDLEPVYEGYNRDEAWWFMKGLFKTQPEKRAIFSKLKGTPGSRHLWLLEHLSEE